MTEQQPQQPSTDPFLDEIRRMKREAAGDLEMPELMKRLREIEERYKHRMAKPQRNDADAA